MAKQLIRILQYIDGGWRNRFIWLEMFNGWSKWQMNGNDRFSLILLFSIDLLHLNRTWIRLNGMHRKIKFRHSETFVKTELPAVNLFLSRNTSYMHAIREIRPYDIFTAKIERQRTNCQTHFISSFFFVHRLHSGHKCNYTHRIVRDRQKVTQDVTFSRHKKINNSIIKWCTYLYNYS